mmetsp:Transcript_66494/g.130416  ORF Transcript_66494/g.130416 Transcript_66494/m.130416 type:complete len:380 (+) Transcript_66494:1-1140(+)
MGEAGVADQGFGPLFANLSVRALPTTEPVGPSDAKNPKTRDLISKANKWWDFVKVRTWELHPYKRIVFLDGDVYFTKKMDSSFDNPECTRVAGGSSPFNAGWFRVDPSQDKYLELINIVQTEEYDKVTGWANQCSATNPDVTKGRLCTHHHDGTKAHRVAGGESTQGLFAYWCDVVNDMDKAIMFHSYNFQDAPYGCRKEPADDCGRCRRIDEGVQAVHATGNCGKHPEACECPELYARWWEAQEMNIPFYTNPKVQSAAAKHPEKLDCFFPADERNVYFTKRCRRKLKRDDPTSGCKPWTPEDFDHPNNHGLGDHMAFLGREDHHHHQSQKGGKTHHHQSHHQSQKGKETHHHQHQGPKDTNPEHGKRAEIALIKALG